MGHCEFILALKFCSSCTVGVHLIKGGSILWKGDLELGSTVSFGPHERGYIYHNLEIFKKCVPK